MSGDVATVSKAEVRAMSLKGQRDVDLLLWPAAQKGQALLVKLAGCLWSLVHCHPRASSAKTRGFHTQLDEGPETP